MADSREYDDAKKFFCSIPAADDIENGPFWLFPTSGEVDKETFLRKKQEQQQKFDAGGYVHMGWTEEQVQARLLSLKEQYPEDMVIGECSVGTSRIENELYGGFLFFNVDWGEKGKNDYPLLTVDGYVLCSIIADTNISAKDFVRVGNTVYMRSSITPNGHVAVVLSRSDNGITIVELNLNFDKKCIEADLSVGKN